MLQRNVHWMGGALLVAGAIVGCGAQSEQQNAAVPSSAIATAEPTQSGSSQASSVSAQGQSSPGAEETLLATNDPTPRCERPRPPASAQQVVDSGSGMRMRAHVRGTLTADSTREWIGPPIPPHVPTSIGALELFLLDSNEDGDFAFYREPYDGSSCTLSAPTNCAYAAHFYGGDCQARWELSINPLLSRPDHLEVQDVQYVDGVLYFNEACQSYSREAKRRCSALVAVRPETAQVLWRTRPLVSNNVFLVHERYIVTGYGFTAEPDYMFIVRRSDGRVMQRIRLPKAHQQLRLRDASRLEMQDHDGQTRVYELSGFDGERPRLTLVQAAEAGGSSGL